MKVKVRIRKDTLGNGRSRYMVELGYPIAFGFSMWLDFVDYDRLEDAQDCAARHTIVKSEFLFTE
jgi:hypothetical protein